MTTEPLCTLFAPVTLALPSIPGNAEEHLSWVFTVTLWHRKLLLTSICVSGHTDRLFPSPLAVNEALQLNSGQGNPRKCR